MTIKDGQRLCKYCDQFLGQEDYHDEFDFFNHPNEKTILRELRKRLDTVGGDIYKWAEKRKLRSEFGVVEPGYSRLFNAYKWLLKLENQDREIDSSRPVKIYTGLPF